MTIHYQVFLLSMQLHTNSSKSLSRIISSLYASIFAVPRIIYSLSSDGLIFSFLSRVLPKFKTPVNAIVFSGFLAGNSRSFVYCCHLE